MYKVELSPPVWICQFRPSGQRSRRVWKYNANSDESGAYMPRTDVQWKGISIKIYYRLRYPLSWSLIVHSLDHYYEPNDALNSYFFLCHRSTIRSFGVRSFLPFPSGLQFAKYVGDFHFGFRWLCRVVMLSYIYHICRTDVFKVAGVRAVLMGKWKFPD